MAPGVTYRFCHRPSSVIWNNAGWTPGGIFSRTTGTNPDAGTGGNILLKAGSTLIQTGGQLSASSLRTGAAGSVTVEGTESPAQSVLIDGGGSGIFRTTSGTGTGGWDHLRQCEASLCQRRHIAARSGPGNAGNILVKANDITINAGGTMTALHRGLVTLEPSQFKA